MLDYVWGECETYQGNEIWRETVRRNRIEKNRIESDQWALELCWICVVSWACFLLPLGFLSFFLRLVVVCSASLIGGWLLRSNPYLASVKGRGPALPRRLCLCVCVFFYFYFFVLIEREKKERKDSPMLRTSRLYSIWLSSFFVFSSFLSCFLSFIFLSLSLSPVFFRKRIFFNILKLTSIYF